MSNTRLKKEDVRDIRRKIRQRELLRAEINNLTNKALAAEHKTHIRNIEKIATFRTWKHVHNLD